MKKHPIGKEFNVDYFRNLIAIAMADGILKDEEREFFQERAKELGLEHFKIEEILTANNQELISESNIVVDEDDFLMDLVAMSMVDGEVHANEYTLCVQLANRQGLSRQDVDDTIRLLQNLLDNSTER